MNTLKANFGNELTREQMKNIMGGTLPLACLAVGEPCTGNVQCCSNRCVEGSGGVTGATCGNTGGNDKT